MMKLLHIDDEEVILCLFKEELALDFPNIEFLTACGGEEGLRIFYEQKPDIVLLDIKMPDIDGLEVLKRIKSTDPDTVVIMVTAYLNYRSDFVTWLCDDYVVKSTDLSVLKDRINFFIKNNRTKNRIYQENFPFPISYNIIALRSKINAKEILDSLFHLTECILKYFVCLLVAENINNKKDLPNIFSNYKYTNLTLGKWYELLIALSKLYIDNKATLYISELPYFFYPTPKKLSKEALLFQQIIQIRNELHRKPFTERQAENVASEIRIMIWDILDKCIFLKEYLLQVVELALPDSKDNDLLYHIKYLVGSHPEFLITPVKSNKIYPYRHVFLKKINCSEILMMHPYIIFDFDPTTRRDDVFIFEKIGKDTIYKSSQQGHFIERDGLII